MMPKPYPSYKDSGIEWLGEVPEGWGVKRLKYLSSCNDESLPESTDPSFEILYVDIGSVSRTEGIVKKEELNFENAPSRARRIVKDGDTIISTVRTYLRAIASIKMPEDNLIVSTGFAVIRPANISSDYLSLFLTSHYSVESVVSRSVGVSYPAINAGEIGNFFSPVPPPQEQQAIAAFLDHETARIDALIQKKERMIELLKEKRIALITQAVTKGLDPNAKMKDSGIEWLGEVPEHWMILPIKRIVSVPVTDGPHETPEILDDGIPFISAESIKGGKIDFDLKRGHISLEDHIVYSKKYKPQLDDIFVIKSGATTGNSAIVETENDFNIWSPLAAIRCSRAIANPRFIFLFVNSIEFITSIQLYWSFGTQQNIGMNVIENLYLPIPPLDEQDTISDTAWGELKGIEQIMHTVENSITLLQEYRSSLIHSAVTGKIDLRGYHEEH
ncbi:MAG: restriction endonuclease subunit S [Candidatus Cloacimonetes bacterium]|nr:restriction endonuclease subunit S [Candidatus Cloacimonadota bacterium]